MQNLAQLKALFEKEWESIVGNCDEFVYLGGNEQATHKYVSELLGKETIDLDTFNLSYGSHGNYTKNSQLQGRELLTPDEIRRLDNKYALLFIRGERPVKDLKYDIMKHPNIKESLDGGAEPYVHGDTDEAKNTIEIIGRYKNEKAKEEIAEESGFLLLSEKDIEEEIKRKEGEQKNAENKE